MTDLSNIKLFVTSAHECSYIDDQEATTLFVDPDIEVDDTLYNQLSELGFRRSGSHLYRPHCSTCKACIAARIPVNEFKASRQQRRCWKRNQDLVVRDIENIDTDEHYALYERYINLRHSDGDMYPPSREQYQSFLSSEWNVTRYLEFRLDDQLIAVAVNDHMESGLSAVYTFFDPSESRRSLGVYAVLYEIQQAQELGLPYLYLGYWIKQCEKMSYKIHYRPVQLFVEQRWVQLS